MPGAGSSPARRGHEGILSLFVFLSVKLCMNRSSQPPDRGTSARCARKSGGIIRESEQDTSPLIQEQERHHSCLAWRRWRKERDKANEKSRRGGERLERMMVRHA